MNFFDGREKICFASRFHCIIRPARKSSRDLRILMRMRKQRATCISSAMPLTLGPFWLPLLLAVRRWWMFSETELEWSVVRVGVNGTVEARWESAR